jgi:hypothetical protein
MAKRQAGTGGTLTLSDSTHTANKAFSGQYSSQGLHLASDGNSETLISCLLTPPPLSNRVKGTVKAIPFDEHKRLA